MKKTPVHYVSNKQMYEALVKYRADKVSNPKLPIPDYLGNCFVQIANRSSEQAKLLQLHLSR
jgi:hypothetical protein